MCIIYVYYVFSKYEVLTHVSLHPINTIKPRKTAVNHPFNVFNGNTSQH